MGHWLSQQSWLAITWMIYGILVIGGGGLALYIELVHAKKVDGASGWLLFGWFSMTLYGAFVMGAISLVAKLFF